MPLTRPGGINYPPLDDTTDPPPSSEVGPTPHGHSPKPSTKAEQGKALPIVYGQAKVAAQLLEKSAAASGQPPAMLVTTAYQAGQYALADVVLNSHGAYIGTAVFLCTGGGTTGSLVAFTTFPGSSGFFAASLDVGQAGLVTGSTTWTCVAAKTIEPINTQQFTAALCEGEITGAINLFWDKEVIAALSLTSPGKTLGLAVGNDAASQNLAGFSAENYQHTAVIYATAAPTGTQKEIPAIAVEIKGVMFGGGGPDVSPADIINDLLTHARRGAAWLNTRVDGSITGGGAASYRTYCDAAGLRLSMVIDSQRTALSIIADLLAATNTEAVWSQGALKAVPLGDTSITSPVFGAVNYTAPSVAAASFGTNAFLDQLNPVQMIRRDDSDCFNAWPIEFTDRASRYVRATVEDQVLDDVEVRGGVVRAGVTSYPIILPNGTRATMLSRILGQRSLKNRNTYTFRVAWYAGILIEPCDLLTLTEPGIGLVSTSVRVTSVSEAEDGTVAISAEDWPVGVQSALAYTPQANDGLRTSDRATVASISGTSTGLRTALDPASVGAAQVAVQQIGVSTMTPGSTFNMFPNPTSEIAPPAGADVTIPVYDSTYSQLLTGSAEWYGRTFIAAAWIASHAYVVGDACTNGGKGYICTTPGTSAGSGGPSGTTAGITDGTAVWKWASSSVYVAAGYTGYYGRMIGAGAAQLRLVFPCTPTEYWYMTAFGRTGTGTNATLDFEFLDANGTSLGAPLSYSTGNTAVWTALGGRSPTAPAGTAMMSVRMYGTGGTALFDAITLRQLTEIPLLAPATDLYVIQQASGAWAATQRFTPPEAWIAPTLGGGFANNGGGAMNAGYYKDITGTVHLRGVLSNAGGCASGTTIFTLPAGYRPSGISMYPCWNTSAASLLGRIWVDASGNVVCQTAVAAAGQIAIDGITFDTR